MELEILKHSFINFIGNLVTFFLLAVVIVWIICVCFNIKNEVLPFGWIPKLFKGIEKALKPVLSWLLEKLQLLFKIIFKLLVFALERLVIFVADVFRKLFDLIKDPED